MFSHCGFFADPPADSHSKAILVRLVGDSEFAIGFIVSVNGCLSLCWLCDKVATCPGCTPLLIS